MLETKLYTALTGSTLITEYAGLRIYPVKLPQQVEFPCISYQRIAGGQVSGLDGYLTLENPTIQIDVWSSTYLAGKTLADNVHAVLDGTTTFRSVLVNDNDLYDDSVEVFRVTMDFSCWDKS